MTIGTIHGCGQLLDSKSCGGAETRRPNSFYPLRKKTVKMAGDMLTEDKEPFLRVAETRKEAQKLQNTPLPAWLAVALMADKGKEQKV